MLWTGDFLRIAGKAVARRPGQTLQDFFATENMAYADAVKAGVWIDPDRRASHMFIKSGLTDDNISHIYGFVYESEAEGPGAALDPRKIQEAVLRFYDKPCRVHVLVQARLLLFPPLPDRRPCPCRRRRPFPITANHCVMIPEEPAWRSTKKMERIQIEKGLTLRS